MEAGSRARVYEILRRSRPLSLGMIRGLHERLHIPAGGAHPARNQPPESSRERVLPALGTPRRPG
jgi:hypothetical protein